MNLSSMFDNLPRAIIWIKTLFPFSSENQLNAQGAVTEIPGTTLGANAPVLKEIE